MGPPMEQRKSPSEEEQLFIDWARSCNSAIKEGAFKATELRLRDSGEKTKQPLEPISGNSLLDEQERAAGSSSQTPTTSSQE